MAPTETALSAYDLSDRYERETGRVYLTGTQALVRIMFDQARRDKLAGLTTAGFVSGYRGSPLGGVDLELWRCRDRLAGTGIEFMPAVNEDLGATAVLGAQQAALDPNCRVDGVFSMWYGKGPGVDRSGDALRHGNAYGSSPHGGVLVVAGDDHGCVSSSMPHQSDVAFMTWFMPTLNPASIDEYMALGQYGFALSRFSGTWVGFKAVSETVESARSVQISADRKFTYPEIFTPPGGLHVRRADLPSPEIETRIIHKLAAVEAFVEANPVDHAIYDIPDARFGIVTTGKGHLDLMEAMRLLGLDEPGCRSLGIDIYKVGMVWPLARRDALAFVRHKEEVLVIEEKRGIIESQFKEYFYDWPGDKPAKMVGKHRAAGDPLVPWTGELSPKALLPILAERLHRFFPDQNFPARVDSILKPVATVPAISGATRTPYFCSGCPHNTSTKVPEGSVAASGIGCHVMASWMGRNTVGYAQMGGEGVPHVAASKFTGAPHIFQNLGEGTWYHSGSLAIRQAVAANTNITFKILYNDAVAMTGGQPVDGPISVAGIAQTCRAEGVEVIAVASDDVTKFDASDFPSGTRFHDRTELDGLQKHLRDVPGVSILIYEQTCATEKRRRRKRGQVEDPPKFAYINETVCEGCGDCSKESNCLSIEPVNTRFGRKRKVNLATCNKDYSCVQGFCPSFVTVENATLKRRRPDEDFQAMAMGLPKPDPADLTDPFDLLVAGVGGTGIVTVSALVTMAAHLENKGASVLDFTGFAQKFGTVLGFVRLANSPEDINQVRIETASASGVIACDSVVASSAKAAQLYRPETKVVLNLAEMPTGDLVLNRDADLAVADRAQAIASVVGDRNVATFDANAIAQACMGDTVFANVIMLGAAWQAGLVPVGEPAMKEAIRLNGVAIEDNLTAFALGRLLVATHDAVTKHLDAGAPDQGRTIENLADYLRAYQNPAYAETFLQKLEALRAAVPAQHSKAIVESAAAALFKLMACKDEYEVARLQTSSEFEARLQNDFEGPIKVNYHFAPPLLNWKRDARGRPLKRQFGPWFRPVLKALAGCRRMRGSVFDPFRFSHDRRLDKELLGWFDDVLARLPAHIRDNGAAGAVEALDAVADIRGYGPVRDEAAQEVKKRVMAILGT